MQKTLDFINKQRKGLYMTVEDKTGPLADGIYEKMEWFDVDDDYDQDERYGIYGFSIFQMENKIRTPIFSAFILYMVFTP